ncbi:hypothetical protein I6A60_37050 [Frankia sp. AgB1.9]|nr:hypothetical protein [Frankia sp. AgW1.1]MBL7553415.1 hypothetical protein [Frankia sp. AgB1.9]MBL7622306.1 hypothetical protein [Frankia sp. AgB1.8]
MNRLVGRLSATSPEFAHWWSRHDIATLCGSARRLLHPRRGEMRLFCEQLTVPPANQRLVTFLATDPASQTRLDQLSGTRLTNADPMTDAEQEPETRPLRLVR